MKRIGPQFIMLLVAAVLTLPGRYQTVAQTAANLSTPIERPIVNATTILLANIDPMRTDLPSWLTTDDTLGQLVASAAPAQNAINSLKTISPKDKIHVVCRHSVFQFAANGSADVSQAKCDSSAYRAAAPDGVSGRHWRLFDGFARGTGPAAGQLRVGRECALIHSPSIRRGSRSYPGLSYSGIGSSTEIPLANVR